MQPLKPIAGVQTSRVQIQNGEDIICCTIEGGDSESTARFLANNYFPGPTAQPWFKGKTPSSQPTGNSLVTGLPANDEEPLELPSMNFSQPTKKAAVISQDLEDNEDEEVLALPVLNFARRAA